MQRLRLVTPKGVQIHELPRGVTLRLGASRHGNDIVVRRVRGVSRHHASIRLEAGGLRVEDLDSKNGLIFNGKRHGELLLRPGEEATLGEALMTLEDVGTSDAERALSFSDAWPPGESASGAADTDTVTGSERKVETASQLLAPFRPSGMVLGRSPKMQALLGAVARAIGSGEDVLLEGETGTGKELFARLLHHCGRTAGGDFVPVNCAEIPDQLLEAKLFGVEKGAATHVAARPGLFEAAHHGTLLLDEIADMPLELQGMLLRVLEAREVRRVGASRLQKLDLRVIAASNRDLRQRMDEGEFRPDLYYRLEGLRFEIPPLRERREDIPELVEAFAWRCAQRLGRRISGVSARALRILMNDRWPGNVRQLRNEIGRAVTRCLDGEQIDSRHLDPRAPDNYASIGPAAAAGSLKERVAPTEKQAIRDVLDRTGWNISETARQLGISRVTLRRRIRKYGIARPPELESRR